MSDRGSLGGDGTWTITIDPDLAQGENIGEFYPEAVEAAARTLRALSEPGSSEHRDAGILAAGALCAGLEVLAKAQDNGPVVPAVWREVAEELAVALQRTASMVCHLVDGSPVRDMFEPLAEGNAALTRFAALSAGTEEQ